MRAVCQRVSQARVTVGDSEVGSIGVGLLVLLGIERGDDSAEVKRLARKTARLRIFEGETGKFERSLVDIAGSVLVVSQFTLIADTRKGNRPSFTNAAPPEEAEPLYEEFCAALVGEGIRVERGVFAARMAVASVNDGPVTIVLE